MKSCSALYLVRGRCFRSVSRSRRPFSARAEASRACGAFKKRFGFVKSFFPRVLSDGQDSTLCACPPCALIFLAVTWQSFTYYPAYSACGKRNRTHFRQIYHLSSSDIFYNSEANLSLVGKAGVSRAKHTIWFLSAFLCLEIAVDTGFCVPILSGARSSSDRHRNEQQQNDHQRLKKRQINQPSSL